MYNAPMVRESPGSRSEQAELEIQRGFIFAIETLEKFKARGMDYRVVGGTAIDAAIDSSYKALRPNGTLRDIDVVIMDDPNNVVPELKTSLAQEAASSANLPPVELTVVREAEETSKLQLLGVFKKSAQGGYALSFRDIEMKLPDELLRRERMTVRLGESDYQFDSFAPGTLFHLYLNRTGSLKHKDIEKIEGFARNLSRQDKFSFSEDHAKYRLFHEFAEEIRARYPAYTRMMRTYNLLDEVFFKGLMSQKLIPRRLWDIILQGK